MRPQKTEKPEGTVETKTHYDHYKGYQQMNPTEVLEEMKDAWSRLLGAHLNLFYRYYSSDTTTGSPTGESHAAFKPGQQVLYDAGKNDNIKAKVIKQEGRKVKILAGKGKKQQVLIVDEGRVLRENEI